MKRFVIFILLFFAIILPQYVCAQTAGDKLFAQGQNQQKIMNLAAQKKAIGLFSKAKIAYDSTDKKAMCDNQIKVCNNIIKAAPWKKKTVVVHEKVVMADGSIKEVSTEDKDATELTLSVSALECKAKGESNTITVNCNRNNWKIETPCDWITYTCNGDKLTIITTKNNENDTRNGIVKVTCGSATAELLVSQKSRATIGKGIKNVGKFVGIK